MNKILIIGRISKRPTLNSTTTGLQCLNMDLETKEKWIDKEGNPKENVTYLKAVQWGKLAEMTYANFSEDDLVAVEGSLAVNNFINDLGRKEYRHEIKIQRIEKI